MQSYKGWSPEFRKKSLRYTKRAKKLGWIPYPKKCQRCGQTEGILHTHNENYDVTYYTLHDVFNRFPISITPEEIKKLTDVLEQICWRCHMMHHSKRRNAQGVKRYFEEIAAGKKYPAVHRHDFSVLKQHGV